MIGPRVGASGMRVGAMMGSDGAAGPPPASTALTVAIADSVDPAISAVNFDYSIVVTNTGAIDATSVTATITLDPSLTYVSSSGTGWTTGHAAGVVTCTRATLAVGAAPTITVTVTTANAASTETTTADAIASNAPAATQDSETTVVKLVDRDASSGVRVPSSSTQVNDFVAYHIAIGTANFPNISAAQLYLCQEASGNLADSIGGVTLTASGASLVYQQAAAGWTRTAFATPDAAANHNAQNTTTAVDVSATSEWVLMYVRMPAAAPAAARRLLRLNSTGVGLFLSTTPRLQCVTGGAGGSTVNGTSNPTGAVRPLVLQSDRAAPKVRLFSDQEKIVGTVGTYSTALFGIGSQGGTSADTGFLYMLALTGANAELSEAQTKALLVALGWSIAWS